jgi:Transglutaminase-like superfamily
MMSTAHVDAFPVASVESYLQPTMMIDSNHPAVHERAALLTTGITSARARAVRLHDAVRDDILFGFSPDFYQQKASDVLRSGMGYCNTKATLFVALLRAAGIPARQVFVDIHADILRGIINPQTPYVDHSYTEVFLGERWVKTDSYIVDQRLFHAALRQLITEKHLLGYGIHAHGRTTWDGYTDSFSQFVQDHAVTALASRNFGIYPDVDAFYEQADRPWNRQTVLSNLFYRVMAKAANRKLARLRSGA